MKMTKAAANSVMGSTRQGKVHGAVINSFPKGGTHLVTKFLKLMGHHEEPGFIASPLVGRLWHALSVPAKMAWNPNHGVLVGMDCPTTVSRAWVNRKLKAVTDNGFIKAHSRYSDHLYDLITRRGMRMVVVIRDLRDIAVSHAHFMVDYKGHVLNDFYVRTLGSFNEQLMFSLCGGQAEPGIYLESIAERARGLEGWFHRDGVLTVRFEDMVGARGQGDDQVQRQTMERIAAHLGAKVDKKQLDEYQQALFGGAGGTFRKGQIGGWRDVFTPEHLTRFNEIAGDILERWGYAA